MNKLPPDPAPSTIIGMLSAPFSYQFSDGSALILSEKGLLMVEAKAPYLVPASTQTSSPADPDNPSDKK